MARYDHLPLFKSTYALVLLVYQVTRKYDREYKYTLGEKIKENAHEILDGIIRTNSLPDPQKSASLKLLLLDVERLRIYFRISCDLHIMTPKFLGVLTERIEEIEKQMNGWMKYASNTEVRPRNIEV